MVDFVEPFGFAQGRLWGTRVTSNPFHDGETVKNGAPGVEEGKADSLRE
jgi:hypothetical protein